MSIYTGRGDSGQTELLGGEKIFKDDLRIEALGALDELNSRLGWTVHAISSNKLAGRITALQEILFAVGALVAGGDISEGVESVLASEVDSMEVRVDSLAEKIQKAGFVLPGGSEASSRLHLCRTACRSAERAVYRACGDKLSLTARQFLNRMSDWLFAEAIMQSLSDKQAD